MRIALFGASGLLGWAVKEHIERRGYEVHNFSCTQKFANPEKWNLVDLSEPEACTRVLLDLWPDAIVNCAAISSPDFVNQNPEYAWNINVNGAQKLAQIASHLGARYIHISTDMVFPGRKEPYRSTDQPSPLSEYGRQKLEAEKKVLSVSDENIVVLRITLLNGNSPQGNRSPHERILGALRKNAPVVLFDDEYRQPCSTHEVASVILELLERPNLNGLFHWAGSELITRYELGLRILKKFGFDHKKITRASLESEVERVGNRPACLAFELQPLRGKLKTEPESIESQLSSLQVPASLYSWFRENVDFPGAYVLRI